MPQQNDDIVSRKSDHIRLSLDDESQSYAEPFASVDLQYRALPEINLSDVSTEVTLLGKKLSQPLIISSMTGGTEHGVTINTNLAIAAESEQIALAVGSQRIGLEKAEATETFKLIRKHAPTTCVFANMGAIQLNNGMTVDDYRKAVDMVEADGLYLHINPLQEAIQPNGDTNYAGLLPKIVKLIESVGVPVFIKEVGHGIDADTAHELLAAGVAGIDVAGVGGTSYAWVEAQRARSDTFAEWFKTVGVPTEKSIRDLAPHKGKAVLIASGGIRNPVQGYQAHILGADFYASTRPFFQASLTSSEAVIDVIREWQRGLQITLFVTGNKRWS